MSGIRTAIELQDNFTGILMNVINAVNLSVSTMEQMQSTMSGTIETTSIEGMRDYLNQATIAAQELDAALQNVTPPETSDSPDASAQSEPATWQQDSLEVFTDSGIARFEQEIQSANEMLNALGDTQAEIVARAAQADIFPPDMTTDMNTVQTRLQEIQAHIHAIESNPLNMGTDTANAGLEQLRAQFYQAVEQQENLNRAVENMDVKAANEAYLQLSRTIGGTEKYIRDNVNEQGRFNQEIEDGTDSAKELKNMIAGAVKAFAGMNIIKKAKDWIVDCTEAFDTQLNAETQLISVLANMMDEEYVVQYGIETGADITGAVDEISHIQDEIDNVTVNVSPETAALTAAFDQIKEKASEIQGRGIYGDEAMIAAAAEFSTYFTDANAIEMMMDTLADYAMGMTGGGEIDSTGMVNYATNLGKIMSGAYDAMNEKGFTFTETQKAIIEGEASREQIVASLGEEYAGMSEDMQAAATIAQVIDESWSGLYESMSNTPEGKIIQIKNAWGDMKEVIGGQLYPYVLLFANAVIENWPTIETVVNEITRGLQFVLGILSWMMEGALNFAQSVIDNWSWLAPIVYGLAGALAVYYGWLLAVKILHIISAGVHFAMAAAQMVHAAATGLLTAATAAQIAAQNGLNGAMYACPITWIVILIIILVAMLYAAVAAINHFAGTSISATGIIAGAFMVLVAHIVNKFIVPLHNTFATFINFIRNAFTSSPGGLCASIAIAFYDMCLTVIGYILNLANAIETLLNKIPGVTVDITSGLEDFYHNLEQAQQEIKDESGWVEYVGKMEYMDYNDAWDQGYAFGEGIEERVKNFDPSDLFGIEDIPSADDYAGALTAGGIGGGIDEIAGNTGAMADSMEISEEELKYLHDIAEQEAINRFTTAEINIDQSGMQNVIKNGMDLDGVITGMTDAMNEAINISTEGVHV